MNNRCATNTTKNQRRDQNPVYDYVKENYGWRLNEAKFLQENEMNDCSLTADSLNSKCIALYDLKLSKWEEATKQIGIDELKKLHMLLDGTDQKYEEAWTRVDRIAFSLKQRGKGAAGTGFEDIVQHLLISTGIYCERPANIETRKAKRTKNERKPDLIITDLDTGEAKIALDSEWRVSCKGTYRDKENDKDNEVQIGYRGELPDKTLKYFAENNLLLIIILPEYREKTKKQIANLGIDNLAVHDLDSGTDELKRRLRLTTKD